MNSRRGRGGISRRKMERYVSLHEEVCEGGSTVRLREGDRLGSGLGGQSQTIAAIRVLLADNPEKNRQQQVNRFELPGFLQSSLQGWVEMDMGLLAKRDEADALCGEGNPQVQAAAIAQVAVEGGENGVEEALALPVNGSGGSRSARRGRQGGRSYQGVEVRIFQRMASRIRRWSTGGRPRRAGEGGGRRGWMRAHCSSVRDIRQPDSLSNQDRRIAAWANRIFE